MPKVTPMPKGPEVKTVGNKKIDPKIQNSRWWTIKDEKELASSIFGVVQNLKQRQGWRQNQAALYARMYCNLPIWNYLGGKMTNLNPQYKFPTERATLNVVQSCIDALKSRMVQSKPKPMFITSGGDYRKRKLAKDLNQFTEGEFYRSKAYEIGEQVLMDSFTLGDGLCKIIETEDHTVGLERTLCTELFVDETDGMYGYPQQLHQLKLIDRDVANWLFPGHTAAIMEAEAAYMDSTQQSTESIASQIMICESWHLPAGKESGDGRHVIAISNKTLLDEEYEECDFPFTKLPYAPRTLGYWAQGIPEQLMGIQAEINKLLYTIQMSLHIGGVPKWLVEDGAKVVTAHLNNLIGGVVKYQGTKPELQTFQCVPPELYQQLERLVQYAYQQTGISTLTAAAQKPAGLDSGAALREFNDLQSDRFAYMAQRWESYYIDLAKKQFKKAKYIANRDGKYSTIYPGEKGLLTIDFPKDDLQDDDYVIQAFPTSALSKNPAERKQEVIDLMQGGLIEPNEGRRLLDFPDLQQEEELLNAAEERILMVLDEMVHDGKYTPPDPQMDLAMAKKITLQYINKFLQEKLPEKRADLLRTFNQQIDLLQAAAMPPPMPMGGMDPMAAPMPTPTSPMVPNVAGPAPQPGMAA